MSKLSCEPLSSPALLSISVFTSVDPFPNPASLLPLCACIPDSLLAFLSPLCACSLVCRHAQSSLLTLSVTPFRLLSSCAGMFSLLKVYPMLGPMLAHACTSQLAEPMRQPPLTQDPSHGGETVPCACVCCRVAPQHSTLPHPPPQSAWWPSDMPHRTHGMSADADSTAHPYVPMPPTDTAARPLSPHDPHGTAISFAWLSALLFPTYSATALPTTPATAPPAGQPMQPLLQMLPEQLMELLTLCLQGALRKQLRS